MTHGRLLAHGLGGRQDLPIPLEIFVVGAAVVVVVSFIALAVLWPRPRLQSGPLEKSRRFDLPKGLRIALGWIGLAGLVLVVVAGLFGVDNSARNITSVLVWQFFWLVIPFSGVLLGNLYALGNPWRRLFTSLKIGDVEKSEQAARLGIYPAAAVFVLFTWLELVMPDSTSPRTLAVSAIGYTLFLGLLATVVGRRTALRQGEAFSVYNRLLSAISPFGRKPDGSPTWRGWLRALPALPEVPGLALFIVAMIGTVTYDGASTTAGWRQLFGRFGQTTPGRTLLLLATVAAIGLGYLAACAVAARMAAGALPVKKVAIRFAHTLIPIAFAYAFAHYFTLVMFEGQYLISTASDPLGLGWDLFGTRDRRIDFSLLQAGRGVWIWYVQVAAIISGHVIGVALAHDRALQDFPGRTAVRSQYAMLVLMVALTGLGLVILRAG